MNRPIRRNSLFGIPCFPPRFCVLLLTIFLLPWQSSAQSGGRRYLVALNPDGIRVAIGKSFDGLAWQWSEGKIDELLQPMQAPRNHKFGSGFAYSPKGDSVYFVTTESNAPVNSAKTHANQNLDSRYGEVSTLWQYRLNERSTATPLRTFARGQSISNVLALMSGAIVFLGRVGEIESDSLSSFTQSRRGLSQYQWMQLQPDGTIHTLSQKKYAFFGVASLIRDEAAVLVQARYISGRPQHFIDATPLRAGVDLTDLGRKIELPSSPGGPRLQCDWEGTTCARLIAVDKKEYLAHQLTVFRHDKACDVTSLPDRIEYIAMARNGTAMALIVRSKPSDDSSYQLAIINFLSDGCPGRLSLHKLP